MNLPFDNDTMIAYMNEGICPYCDKKGFKMVGLHINKTHGIPFEQLKDDLLIPRRAGFVDSETKNAFSRNANNNKSNENFGFNQQRHDENVKGVKKPKISVEKMKMGRLKNEKEQGRVKSMMKDPAIKSKSVETRMNNGATKHANQRILIKRYGTINGYTDEKYVGIAVEFISELEKNGSFGIYERIGKLWGMTHSAVGKRVSVLIERGLIIKTGFLKSLKIALTEKAINILNH